MEPIKVDVDGLAALGAVCKREAEALSVDRGEVEVGPSYQATTTAVHGVLRMAGRADNLITMRLRVTGHTIVRAADRLADCEGASRREVEAVGAAVVAS